MRVQFIRNRWMQHAQASVHGATVSLAGQGGWDEAMTFPASLSDEFDRAFQNVTNVLAEAGADWSTVTRVVSLHVDLAGAQDLVNALMYERLADRTDDRVPPWTCIGVAALGDPRMRVEIQVDAVRL